MKVGVIYAPQEGGTSSTELRKILYVNNEEIIKAKEEQ